MPRARRVDFPGARHHVMNRGARHRTIFENDEECAEFIGFAAELPERFGVLVHAYALMPNHYHLAVESTRGRLSAAMSFLAGRYTQWSNNRHRGWDGSIFRGRFRNIVVYRDVHWHYLPLYLHLNPLRAGLVCNLAQSRWTSHGAYAGIDPVPEWLTTDDLLEGYGGTEGYLESLGDVVLGASNRLTTLSRSPSRPIFDARRRRSASEGSGVECYRRPRCFVL